MGKIEKIKLWFYEITKCQVSTKEAQNLLDMMGDLVERREEENGKA